jgi:RNA polymerase sigma factor (sigma-70 family)
MGNNFDESFENIYNIYIKNLYFTALVILKNQQDAEDAIQEVLIDVYKGLKNLKDLTYLKTWLTRILINRCNKILKKRKKSNLYTQGIDLLNFTDALNIEDKLLIKQIIESLDKEDRMLIMLRFLNDLEIKEISKILNKPEGTIKSKIHRLLKKIKLELDKE